MYPTVLIEGDTGEVLRMTSVEVNFWKTVGMVLSLGSLGGVVIFSISSRSLIIL